MFRVDLPVSLNVSLRLSPFNRLMPLKDESCAVVVDLMRYVIVLRDQAGAGRLRVRVGDRRGNDVTAEQAGAVVAVPPKVPIVEEAASFEVVMVILPVESIVACRLFAANAVFRSLSVEI